MSIKISTSVPSQVLTQSPKKCCNGDHKDANRDWNIAARSMSCVLAKKAAEVAALPWSNNSLLSTDNLALNKSLVSCD
jgi:hypothetical protein